eukprot:343983-Pleurochrysis_carterae.AAC.1
MPQVQPARLPVAPVLDHGLSAPHARVGHCLTPRFLLQSGCVENVEALGGRNAHVSVHQRVARHLQQQLEQLDLGRRRRGTEVAHAQPRRVQLLVSREVHRAT